MIIHVQSYISLLDAYSILILQGEVALHAYATASEIQAQKGVEISDPQKLLP